MSYTTMFHVLIIYHDRKIYSVNIYFYIAGVLILNLITKRSNVKLIHKNIQEEIIYIIKLNSLSVTAYKVGRPIHE